MDDTLPSDDVPADDSLPPDDSPVVPANDSLPDIFSGGEEPPVALTLTDSDFDAEPPSDRALRKPGPGLLEAFVWIAGVVMVQFLGAIPVLVFLVGKMLLSLNTAELQRLQGDPDQLQEFVLSQMQDALSNNIVLLFGTIQIAVIVSAIVAVLLRLGKNRRQALPLRAIPLQHCVMLGLLIFPLILFSGQLSVVFQQVLDAIAPNVPVLDELNKLGAKNEIAKLAEQASLTFLLLMIAVIPAIAEEIVFRGIIGRGLVARWGMLWGVLITTVLFAVVHVQPAQVLALMPLAICMHVAYLATRSFWAPMAIHFINNAAAVVVMKLFAGSADMVDQAQQADPSWTILVTSGCCALALISLIWKTRVQYVHADGTLWDPGYPSADIPSPEFATVSTCMRTRARSFVVAAVLIVLFGMTFIWNWLEEAASAAAGV